MVKLFSPLSLFKRLSAVPKYSMGIFLGFPSILRGSQIDQYALPIDFLDDKKAMGSTSRLVQ